MNQVIERIASQFRRLRHGVLDGLPQPLYLFFRTAALTMLSFLSGGGRLVMVAGYYPLRVEWERAAIDFTTLEASFTKAFGETLQKQQTVIDVGASIGEWSALAATLVGADHVHVFEPDLPSWRHIQKVFKLNSLTAPAGMFPGFVAAVDSDCTGILERARSAKWPDHVEGTTRFHNLYEGSDTPTVTLDTYCNCHSVAPKVIKIDVEGAEGEVLRGSQFVLKHHKPLLFLSLHPWLLGKYNDSAEELLGWIKDRGYGCTLLGRDHEEHWLCTPS